MAEQTSEEAQKRLKAERQRGASRRQCETGKQRAHRLLVKNAANIRCHQNEATKQCTEPIDFKFRILTTEQYKRVTTVCAQDLYV